jgi:hypothetical protein
MVGNGMNTTMRGGLWMKRTGLIVFVIVLASCGSSAKPAQSGEVEYDPCEAYVVMAIPQMLSGAFLDQEQQEEVIQKAKNKGIILKSGRLSDRAAFSELILDYMGNTRVGILFGSDNASEAPYAYILEVVNGDKVHFVLAGHNKNPIYQYDNPVGTSRSSQAVYVYTR